MDRFNGIATRYLQHYLAYFRYMDSKEFGRIVQNLKLLCVSLYFSYLNEKGREWISIKKIIVLIAFFCLVFLFGCSKDPTEQIYDNHLEYLESFGWHIEDKISERTQDTKKTNLDAQIAGIDLEPYNEVEITTYLLKEKQKTGKKIYASIYEYNGHIIGGNGQLEEWLPGVFSLKDQERLINEGTIN
jgi:hypothetical protein